MLTITFCACFLGALACWRTWHRAISILVPPHVCRVRVWAYWVLAFALLCDFTVSLCVRGENLSRHQLGLLVALSLGLTPQLALFVALITPLLTKGPFEGGAFMRALAVMGAFAIAAILMLVTCLAWILLHSDLS